MTEQELKDAWERYMHRADLAADLDRTYQLAREKVAGRLMFDEVDLDAILANNPRVLLHGGLAQLAELAQDDVQLRREEELFELAISDLSFRTSINQTKRPVMSRPYFDGGDNAA